MLNVSPGLTRVLFTSRADLPMLFTRYAVAGNRVVNSPVISFTPSACACAVVNDGFSVSTWTPPARCAAGFVSSGVTASASRCGSMPRPSWEPTTDGLPSLRTTSASWAGFSPNGPSGAFALASSFLPSTDA